METGLANQPGPLVGQSLPAAQLGSHPAAAQPWDIHLDYRQAGLPRMDIQPALVVDILDARVLLLAKVSAARGQVAAARGHQDQVAAANQLKANCLLAANCLLFQTAAVARTEQAPEAHS